MVGLWILGLVAGIAWFAGLEWLIGIGLVVVLLFLSGVLSGLAGLSRRRSHNHKDKYHPAHYH